jgi:hypothetical protein
MRPLLFLAIVGGLLALVPAAAADPPTIVEQSLHRSIPNFASCPGFTVAGEFDVNRTLFTFVDANGTPIERVIHVHFTGTLTNTSTGKSIPDEGNQIVSIDLLTGVTTVDGRLRVDTVPGEGVILAQTGRIVTGADGTVLFIAGQHDLQNGLPDADGFCAYMAAP